MVPLERSLPEDGSGGCAVLDDGTATAIDGGGGDHSICAGVAPTHAVDCPYVYGVGAVGIATGAFTATDEAVGDASRSSITMTSKTFRAAI